MDALIIAVKFRPLPVLEAAIQFVSFSRPVVVFCEFVEPLIECQAFLKIGGRAVNIILSERWTQESQVRT